MLITARIGKQKSPKQSCKCILQTLVVHHLPVEYLQTERWAQTPLVLPMFMQLRIIDTQHTDVIYG